MSDNVVHFEGSNYVDVDPRLVLEEVSKKEGMKHAFILTEQEDGSLCFHCSTSDSRAMLMWVEQWKHNLLNGSFDE